MTCVTIDLGDLYPALKGERVRGQLQGKRVVPYPDRAQLADGKLLAGRGTACGSTAPIDAFFLQIQGSGRVRLPDGSTRAAGLCRRERPALSRHRHATWWTRAS